jgi:peroxiredoxin Q/BCP
MNLSVGQAAPPFSGIDQHGNTISLSDFAGKRLALYFYPKDDTPGCTAQACSLRDGYSDLLAQGIAVVGVSPDSVEDHAAFAEKFSLPFPLIADVDKLILTAYDAYGEKNLYGKMVMGVKRTTYLIDAQGNIERIIKRPDTKAHAAQLLK